MTKKIKKKNKIKGTISIIILTVLLTTIGMYLYNTYWYLNTKKKKNNVEFTVYVLREEYLCMRCWLGVRTLE